MIRVSGIPMQAALSTAKVSKMSGMGGIRMIDHARNRRLAARATHLDSLRSVSAAFKATVKEEPLYVPRQRIAEAPRNPPQASNPGGDGRPAQAGDPVIAPGGIWFGQDDGHGGNQVTITGSVFFPQAAGNGQLINGQGRMAAIQMAAQQHALPSPTPKSQPKTVQAGEIIAWRAWSFMSTRGRPCLRSISAQATWEPNVIMDDMRMGTGVKSTGGIHAFKTRACAERNFSPRHYIIGEVSLWGEVIEHEDGYRAQYGAIHSLVDGPPALLPALQKRYGLGMTSLASDRPADSGTIVLIGTIAAGIALAFILLANMAQRPPHAAQPTSHLNYTTPVKSLK